MLRNICFIGMQGSHYEAKKKNVKKKRMSDIQNKPLYKITVLSFSFCVIR